jgi:hypothetical protein
MDAETVALLRRVAHWLGEIYGTNAESMQEAANLASEIREKLGSQTINKTAAVESSEPCSDGATGRRSPSPVANRDSGVRPPE